MHLRNFKSKTFTVAYSVLMCAALLISPVYAEESTPEETKEPTAAQVSQEDAEGKYFQDVAVVPKDIVEAGSDLEIDSVVFFFEDGTKGVYKKEVLEEKTNDFSLEAAEKAEEGINDVKISLGGQDYQAMLSSEGYVSPRYITDKQRAILDIALSGTIYESQDNMCAAWVSKVFNAAGHPYYNGSGPDWWRQWGNELQTDMTNVPAGAVVVGTGKYSNLGGSYYLGHVGICLGDTNGDGVVEVIDCIGAGPGGIATWNITDWVTWQIDGYCGNDPHAPGYVGWVWMGGINLQE